MKVLEPIYIWVSSECLTVLGFALALVLLLGSYYISWSIALLPLWVLLLSVYVLFDNLRRPQAVVDESDADGSN